MVLEAAGYSGADLDDCITDAGGYTRLAAEAVAYSETYGEVSPSGAGLHFLVEGAVGRTIKRDDLGIELYDRGRYFTITGNQIDDLPTKIAPAPKLIERLIRLDAETPKPGKEKKPGLNGHAAPNLNRKVKTAGDDFFPNVNAAALDDLDAWVPRLHPTARKHPNGAWRVKAKQLGRDLEEDLSYHPNGIQEFGLEEGLSPIDAVVRYGTDSDPKSAAMWLCRQMGVEPAALGWRGRGADKKRGSEAQLRQPPNGSHRNPGAVSACSQVGWRARTRRLLQRREAQRQGRGAREGRLALGLLPG